MSNRWWTSDLHLGHTNIIRYSGRPFASTEKMNQAIVDRWNDRVQPEDEVWILGDIALSNRREQLEQNVSRLHGLKVLIPGNHDSCWQGHRKGANRRAMYEELGGLKVVDNPEPVMLAGHSVTISHFPFWYSKKDLRYSEWHPRDQGDWLLHGHVHEGWRQKDRQINVGVDAWSFAPVESATLEKIIEHGPASYSPMDIEAS